MQVTERERNLIVRGINVLTKFLIVDYLIKLTIRCGSYSNLKLLG